MRKWNDKNERVTCQKLRRLLVLWWNNIATTTKIKDYKCRYKMTNFNGYANENKTKHNQKKPHISDHRYGKLIIGGSGSGEKMHY